MTAQEAHGTGFGQLLRRFRRASGLSQEELAERAGVAVRTIRDLERGQRTRPYRRTVSALAEAIGLQGAQLDEFVRLSRLPGADQALRYQALGDPRAEAAGDQYAPVPQQLPGAVTDFTGRDRELATLNDLLEAPATDSPVTMLITAIGGTAGVGKTGLAVHWAHRAASQFPDGQLYVNLRGYHPGQPLSPGDALARFLRALGVPGHDIPAEDDERASLYRSLLAERRVLVVLDNARDSDQVRPLLPGTAGCAALVTSRDTLAGLVARDGARRLDLDVLSPSDAVSLLRALVGIRVDAEPEAAAALARHCSRLPLALRVAAEQAAARPETRLADLAAELADQQQRLNLLDAGGDQGTAVRTVFSWSLRHLDPETKRAFRLLGIHPGPDFDGYAAAALADTSLEHARGLLGQLARAYLIQATGQDRYAMHDLLRDYARELAAGDEHAEQRAALSRLSFYYLHAAVTAMRTLYPAEERNRPDTEARPALAPALTEPNAARAWLDAELACMVSFVAQAASGDQPEHASQMAGTIFRYLDSGGHLTEAVIVHTHARNAAQRIGDVATEAGALTCLAAAEIRQGRDQDAADHLQQALTRRHQAGDRRGEGSTLGNLGVLAWFQGRYEQASSHYQRALDLFRETGDRSNEATSLCNLAGATTRLGRLGQSIGHLEHALALSREIDDQLTEAYVLVNLGDVNLRRGSYQQAARNLRQGLELSRDTGDRINEAAALASLGEIDLRQGRYKHAKLQLDTALALARDAGARSAQIDAHTFLGDVCLATGDQQTARVHYADALGLATKADDTYLQARAHDRLARAHRASQDIDQASHHWQQALTIYARMSVPEADQVRAQLAADQ